MQNMTVDDIIDGMIKITLNAQSLADEAELLLNNKYFARSYTLAHIAREEISKLYPNKSIVQFLLFTCKKISIFSE